MRLLYTPFRLISSLIAARVGKSIFRALWSGIDRGAPPATTTQDASMAKVVGAKALEAATMASVAAAADRISATVFAYLTGTWPGKEPDKKDQPQPDAR